MNNVNSIQNNETFKFRGFDTSKTDQSSLYSSNFIKHQLHQKRIDEFFRTNSEAPHKKFSPLALIGSIAGVVVPLLILGKKQNPELKLNSLKNVFKATNIKYDIKEIIAVGCGGVVGGLMGGLADRNEPHKRKKMKEATFQLMNITFPTLLVGNAIKLCEKTRGLNNSAAKIICSAASMVAGAFIAVTVANKVDNTLFDKYNIEHNRKLKKKDFIVHVDDLVGTLVLAKIPLADKLHVERLLPFIFSWNGFHVGES